MKLELTKDQANYLSYAIAHYKTKLRTIETTSKSSNDSTEHMIFQLELLETWLDRQRELEQE